MDTFFLFCNIKILERDLLTLLDGWSPFVMIHLIITDDLKIILLHINLNWGFIFRSSIFNPFFFSTNATVPRNSLLDGTPTLSFSLKFAYLEKKICQLKWKGQASFWIDNRAWLTLVSPFPIFINHHEDFYYFWYMIFSKVGDNYRKILLKITFLILSCILIFMISKIKSVIIFLKWQIT